MPSLRNESSVFRGMREDPLSVLDRALALQNPDSFEYKKLMDIYQVVSGENELCIQLMMQLARADAAEEKAFERKLEIKLSKQKAKEERESALSRNEEIDAEQRQAAKSVAELHREITERVQKIKELDRILYQYEQEKEKVDHKIVVKDKEIKALEKVWHHNLEKAADQFISDNFTLNDQGTYVSSKNPAVELLKGAVHVIKKIFTETKSPAEMIRHNPKLIDNPERMMQLDDVRKDLSLARKIDKIIHKDIREKLGHDRKIVLKQIVFDVDGNPKMEMDEKTGKLKVVTRRVEITPQRNKLKDANATDESRITYAKDDNAKDDARRTKIKEARLVCLGNVCVLKRDICQIPISHTPDNTVLATKLMMKGGEKRELEEESYSYAHKIRKTKTEISSEKDGADRAYTKIKNLQPDAKIHPKLQDALQMSVSNTNDQVTLAVDKKKTLGR